MKYLIILFVVVITSCSTTGSNKVDKNKNFSTINIESLDSVINLSTIFKTHKLYSLQDETFGTIKKVLKYSNKLVLWVKSDSYRLIIYDIKSGKYKKCYNIGKGVGEYLGIYDLQKYNNTIEVYEFEKKRIISFDLDGNKLNSIEIPTSFDVFSRVDKDTYALFEEVARPIKTKQYKLKLYSISKNKVISQHFENTPELSLQRSFAKQVNFYRYKGKVNICQTFSDTVYEINNNRINPRFIFDFAKYKLPVSLRDNPKRKLMDFVNICLKSNYIWNVNHFYEIGNKTIFTFNKGKDGYIASYDQVTNIVNTGKRINHDIFLNIKEDVQSLNIRIVGVSEKSIIFSILPYFINLKYDKMRNLNKSQLNFVDQLNDLSNEVLIEYKI